MAVLTLDGPIPGSATAAAIGLCPRTIDPGMTVQCATNLQAASGNANNLPQGPAFVIQPAGAGQERTLNVSAVGIAAVPTTVTANLLASYDGGATWQTFATNMPLVAAGVAAASEVLHLAAGAIYAFALSTLALGNATGVNIVATLS